ncbi:hypothetical protein FHG87_020850 [Trinorchestia longiramus]|nr:hypothetical protein FHG87_020850 [Trinorchestia longiramus]
MLESNDATPHRTSSVEFGAAAAGRLLYFAMRTSEILKWLLLLLAVSLLQSTDGARDSSLVARPLRRSRDETTSLTAKPRRVKKRRIRKILNKKQFSVVSNGHSSGETRSHDKPDQKSEDFHPNPIIVRPLGLEGETTAEPETKSNVDVAKRQLQTHPGKESPSGLTYQSSEKLRSNHPNNEKSSPLRDRRSGQRRRRKKLVKKRIRKVSHSPSLKPGIKKHRGLDIRKAQVLNAAYPPTEPAPLSVVPVESLRSPRLTTVALNNAVFFPVENSVSEIRNPTPSHALHHVPFHTFLPDSEPFVQRFSSHSNHGAKVITLKSSYRTIPLVNHTRYLHFKI